MVAPKVHWTIKYLRHGLVLCLWIDLGLILLSYGVHWTITELGWFSQTGGSIRQWISGEDKSPYIDEGSIILVSPQGDRCLKRMFDNRTGKVWDVGQVNCYEAISDLDNKQATSERSRVISKAFRSKASDFAGARDEQ